MDEQLEYNKDADEIAKWYVQPYNKENETAAQHENKGKCDRQIGLNHWMGFHTVKYQNGDKAARFLI